MQSEAKATNEERKKVYFISHTDLQKKVNNKWILCYYLNAFPFFLSLLNLEVFAVCCCLAEE
jgi:hypothetical protein